MLDYIWLNDEYPILNQVPKSIKSAAILLHPFVQMPLEWEQSKGENHCEYVYPSTEEILTLGNPVFWQEIMNNTNLETFEEVELGLKTSIGALRTEYARKDLADKLNLNWKEGLYYPTEDNTSIFLISDIIKIFGSKGAKKIYFSAPIFDNSGFLETKNTDPLEIGELAPNELILTDENNDFIFMSVYDSFFTVFLSKDKNIGKIIESMNWEAIICNEKTYINWYLER